MTIEAQLPGGTTLQFPDGTPDAVVQGAVKQQLSQRPDSASQTPESKLGLTPAPETKPPALVADPLADVISSPEAGAADIPQSQAPAPTASPPVTTKGLVDAGVRGVGLGTRATVEGLSGLPAMAADAVTWPMRATQRALGIPTTAPSDIITHGLDAAGLPKPETPSEQLTSATVGGVASVLPTIAVGGAPALIRAYPTVAKALADRLLAQAAAGGASAGSQEETRQLGGGPIAQFGVGTLAGLLAAHAVSPNTLAPSPGSGPRFIQEYFGEGTPTNPLAAYPPKRMPAFVPPGTNLPPEPLLRQPRPIQEGTVTPQGGPAPSPQESPAFVPPKAQPADAGGATQTAAAAPPPTGESAASIAASGGYREAPAQQSPLAPTVAPDGTLAPPKPSVAGAQVTPAAELGITPAEEAAYRSTAEGNKLLEPQEPGVRDDKQYLTGEKINEAEASQDVETARNLKSLRQQTPQLDKEMTADENHNNNLRYNAINNAIPGQVQITAAKTAREDAMKAAEPKVFGGPNVADADVQPIVTDIQEILNDPKNRQNTQLGQYVRPLIDRLQNPDGTPKIVDPRELWGFRQDVQHLTSGAAQAQDKNLSRVSGILGRVLDSTDNQIEAAAPGYKAQLRDDYRTRSREIDAMEALNAERFKLFDTQNVPNYNAVQGLMRRITDARQANDPYEPFTHVQQGTLDQLWNIRDTMRRSRAADRLAAPKGSPTSQNLGDALRTAGRMAIQNAAPAAGAGLGAVLFPSMPVVGSTAGLFAGTAINHLLSERALAQRLAEGRTLLQPNRLGPQPSP